VLNREDIRGHFVTFGDILYCRDKQPPPKDSRGEPLTQLFPSETWEILKNLNYYVNDRLHLPLIRVQGKAELILPSEFVKYREPLEYAAMKIGLSDVTLKEVDSASGEGNLLDH
jgi:hypothetical protein